MSQQQPQDQDQPFIGMSPQSQIQTGAIPEPVSPVGPEPTAAASTTHKHAMQLLMHTLRSPNTLEKQNQILKILKSNPQLMASFIKQKPEQATQLEG